VGSFTYPAFFRTWRSICQMWARIHLGLGLNFSSTWRVVGRDTINYQDAYGKGIARYTATQQPSASMQAVYK